MWSRKNFFESFALLLLLSIAAYFRFTGVAWDSGYLFHPDERQILLVVSRLRLPTNFLELVSPASPLNPNFFAYGSFPIYLLRALAPLAPTTPIVGPWSNDELARWILFGRFLSGVFDLGTIALTYALGKKIYNAQVGLLAAACVAVTVLHIQLSHFYAVDTLLTFFTLAVLYCAFRVAQETIESKYRFWILLCGITFGLALATKITALPLVFPILYACCRATNAPTLNFTRARFVEIWRAVRKPFLQICGVAFFVFVVTQPYALMDWYAFGSDVVREALLARGWLDYPYTRQFAGTLPFAYQVTQGAIWGMGLPLGIFAWGGGVLFVAQWGLLRVNTTRSLGNDTRDWRDAFVLSFALIYFLTIGLQYTKYLRYLAPLLPILYIMAACAWMRVFSKQRVVLAILVFAFLALSFLYAFAFTNLYAREHTWLTASRWIYENVPIGKTLLIEQWDDALPTMIRFKDGERRASDYTQIQFPIFDADTDEKRAQLVQAIARADYIVLASQRGYASIGKLPERYPMTNRYYEKLFNGALGFEPVFTARNDPHGFGITLRDDPFAQLTFDDSPVNALLPRAAIWNWGFADESFSVYDHPQPIVFEKKSHLSAAELEVKLRE